MKNKKIITVSVVLTILLLVIFALTLFAETKESYRLYVETKNEGDISVYISGVKKGVAPIDINVKKGETVRLVNNSDDFLFYSDRANSCVGNGNEYVFNMYKDEYVCAWNKTQNADKTTVLYRNTNSTKQIISYTTYKNSEIESLFSSHKEEETNKFGYTFLSWNKTASEIVNEAKNGNGIIIVEPVYKENSDKYTISVTNGHFADSVETIKQISINETVTLVADEKQGKTFKCWVDSDGCIVSDQPEITVYGIENQMYTAKYDDYDKEIVPFVSLSYEYCPEYGKIRSFSKRFLPEGYTLLSYGLVYSKNTDIDESKLYLDAGDNDVKSVYYGSAEKNGISINWVASSNGVSARAFVNYLDSEGNVATVYSSALKMVFPKVKTVLLGKEFSTDAFSDSGMTKLSYKSVSDVASGKLVTNGKIVAPSDLNDYEFLTASMSISIKNLPTGGNEFVLIKLQNGIKALEEGEIVELDWDETVEYGDAVTDLVKVSEDGYVYLYDGANEQWKKTTRSIEAGRRYKFQLDVDTAENLAKLYINDSFVDSAFVDSKMKSAIQLLGGNDNMVAEIVRAKIEGIRKPNFTCKDSHDYLETTVAPNCVHDGYILHTCNDCGESYKDGFVSNQYAHHSYDSRYLTSENTVMHCECTECGKIEDKAVNTLYYVIYDNDLKGTKEISEEIAYAFESKLGYAPIVLEKNDVPAGAKIIDCAGVTAKLDTFGWSKDGDNYSIFNGGFVSYEEAGEKFIEYMNSIPTLSLFESSSLEAEYINNYNYKRYEENTLVIDTIEKLSRNRAEEIMNTPNTDVSGITGRVFYFSSINGNDDYPENTIDTPWKTLSKLEYECQAHRINKVNYPAVINPGDAVLFERGSVYRGGFKFYSDMIYGCYGDESLPKPAFLGSRDNFSTLSTEDNGVKYASEQKWVRYDGNIWKLNLADGETKIKNPGFMIFVPVGEQNTMNMMDCQNVIRGDRYIDLQLEGADTDTTDDDVVVTGLEQLTENFRFYNGTLGETTYLTFTHSERGKARDLYVYYDGDLNADFSDIEIAESGDIFNIGPVNNTTPLVNVVIDNLTLKYTGTHGFDGGGRAKIGTDSENNPIYQFPTNITIKNCVMCWIGGSVYACWGTRDGVTRYGNAVQIYGGVDGFYVENNWIYQIYDTAITVQFGSDDKYTDAPLVVDDIHFNNNVMESTYWSVEFWASNKDNKTEPGKTINREVVCNEFELAGNIFNRNYSGWGSSRRPDPTIGATISLSGIVSSEPKTEKYMFIHDNIIGPSYIEGKSGNETRPSYEYMGSKAQGNAYRTRIYATNEASFDLQLNENNYLIQYDDQNFGRVDSGSKKNIYFAGNQSDMEKFFTSMGETVEDEKEHKFMLIHRVLGETDLSDYN